MDRDSRWDRVELAYDMLVGDVQVTAASAQAYITERYDAGETDEFLRPVSIAGRPEDAHALKIAMW